MITQTQPVKTLDKKQLTELQTALQKLGYYTVTVDGIYGKHTGESFADWKTDNHLADTTHIGVSSWQLLKQQADKIITVNWNDFTSKISKYFTVGEVAQGLNNKGQYIQYRDRIPTNTEHRKNAIRLAEKLDEIRDWWGSGLLVTSWYRPPHVERQVGGSGHTHPFGLAADIRPANNAMKTLQDRFEKEWYNTNKWQGGFGKGLPKGFIHLDLKNRRVWNY